MVSLVVAVITAGHFGEHILVSGYIYATDRHSDRANVLASNDFNSILISVHRLCVCVFFFFKIV